MQKSSVLVVLVCSLVVILCLFGPTVGKHMLNAVELINRENAKINLESDVGFSVNPTYLYSSGEWVTVKWHYVDDPSDSDWVGVYSPPLNDVYQINPSKHAPIKLQFANYSSTHLSMGRGYLQFQLMNMRAKVLFGFFRGGLEDPTLVAISSTVSFKNYNEPLQGHLSLTGDPTEMTLMWVTKKRKMPVVYWGKNSGSYSDVKTATSITYNASDMCGSPATDFGWRNPGLLHKAVMDNLSPATKYYYIFGDYYGWSQEYSFKTAPKAGADVTTTIISFGDMGCGEVDDSEFVKEDIQPGSINTTDNIATMVDEIDFVFHIGDVSYARGYSAVWDIFFNQIEPIATRVPYMVCVGNHERNWDNTYPGIFNNSDSGGECGLPYYLRFPMPRVGYDKPWFAWDYGQVHFVVMSTEHDFSKGTAQYRWLSNHLANVDRTTTPWLVFTGHRPMYIASRDENDHLAVAEDLRDSLEDLLYTYNVDLAMWAHVHCYQRTCQLYQEECVEGAPVHVVIGMGGRELATDAEPDSYDDYFEVVDYYNWGFTKMTANSTTLVWEYIHNSDNQVYDTLVLTKSSSDGSTSVEQSIPRANEWRVNQNAKSESPNEL